MKRNMKRQGYKGSVMRYVSSICSDIGIRRKINQDAALVCQAKTEKDTILFAVVCDGMGGLEKGELASSTVISRMSDWFQNVFPSILQHEWNSETLKKSWIREIAELNKMIYTFGKKRNIRLGTTLTMLLLAEDTYYICNVGDSRIYYLRNTIQLITRDQSYVQREVDMGRMTKQEALRSNQRNILLQCIGAGVTVMPDFYKGKYKSDASFVLCSDGFWNAITEEEIWNMLRPDELDQQKDMDEKIEQLVETVKHRKEEDNITVTLIHAV